MTARFSNELLSTSCSAHRGSGCRRPAISCRRATRTDRPLPKDGAVVGVERRQRVDYGSSLSRTRLPESCRSRTSPTGHERSSRPMLESGQSPGGY